MNIREPLRMKSKRTIHSASIYKKILDILFGHSVMGCGVVYILVAFINWNCLLIIFIIRVWYFVSILILLRMMFKKSDRKRMGKYSSTLRIVWSPWGRRIGFSSNPLDRLKAVIPFGSRLCWASAQKYVRKFENFLYNIFLCSAGGACIFYIG